MDATHDCDSEFIFGLGCYCEGSGCEGAACEGFIEKDDVTGLDRGDLLHKTGFSKVSK